MKLKPQEATLVEAFRRLPPSAATEISALVDRLAALPPGTRVDWSDDWSEDDLRDFRAHSLAHLDREEAADDEPS